MSPDALAVINLLAPLALLGGVVLVFVVLLGIDTLLDYADALREPYDVVAHTVDAWVRGS
jgi:hypothetical protein